MPTRTLSERKLDDLTIMTAAIMAATYWKSSHYATTCEEVAKKLAAISEVVDLSHFHLTPGGEFSEDVVQSVALGAQAGHYDIQTGIGFTHTPKGRTHDRKLLLAVALNPDTEEQMAKVAQALGLRISFLLRAHADEIMRQE